MYKICFYVPTSHLESVKSAMFKKGAGKIGNYGCCAWQAQGIGQFMPLEGSNAFIGMTDQLETLEEYKVEMVCKDTLIKEVIAALKDAHPYEEPAYHVWRVEDL